LNRFVNRFTDYRLAGSGVKSLRAAAPLRDENFETAGDGRRAVRDRSIGIRGKEGRRGPHRAFRSSASSSSSRGSSAPGLDLALIYAMAIEFVVGIRRGGTKAR
jgi:hypothetical protein